MNQNQVVKKKTKWTVQGALGLMCFFVFSIYCCMIAVLHSDYFDSIVLAPFPPKEKEYSQGAELDGVKAEERTIKAADGGNIDCFYFRKPGAKSVVIFHHGNAGNLAYRMAIAEKVLQHGSSMVLYDYRGFGKSSGHAHISELVEDGVSTWDYTNKVLKYPPSAIINYGESIGTGVACHVAADRPSGGLIMQSTIGSLPRMGHAHFCFLAVVPDLLFPRPQLDNVNRIRQIHAPLLMIHGEKDTMAPMTDARLVFANANGPKQFVVLASSGHNDIHGDVDNKVFDTALTQFQKQIESSTQPIAQLH